MINQSGYTALHMASENGHVSTIELLLNHQADVNAKSDVRWMYHDNVSCIYVINHMIMRHLYYNQGGWTALHEAADNGHVAAVKMLLNYGADVNAKSKVRYNWDIYDWDIYDWMQFRSLVLVRMDSIAYLS